MTTGASTGPNPGMAAKDVRLDKFPRLLHATASQRAERQIAGARFGIHWPDIYEDLSTEGLLAGIPAPAAR